MAYVEGRVVHDADAHVMETPTWLRDHAEAGSSATELPVLTYSSGNELRQTGDPDEQQRDLLASFDRLREQARLRRLPRDRGRRDHAAQELRRDGRVHRRGPPARARPARLLEPADLQHVPQQPALRPRARRRPRPRLRRRPRAQPRHPRVLRGRPAPARRPATSRSPTPRAPPRRRSEAIAPGRRRDPRRLGLPAAVLARATSTCSPCGPSSRRRACPSSSTSGAPGTSSTRTTS